MKIKNRTRYIAFAASILLLYNATAYPLASSKIKGGGSGIKFDNHIMDYKDRKSWEDYNDNDEMNKILSKVDSMKDSGEWGLDGVEIDQSVSRNKPGNYPTTKGSANGTEAWKDSFNAAIFKKNPQIDHYLQQPMSERARLLLIAASSKIGWEYGQGSGRTSHTSGYTDCSGFVYLACDAAGLKAPAGRTSEYVNTNTAYTVPWEEKQPGDILWRNGHVEFYIGKDENGKERTLGAHKPGTPAGISSVSGRGSRSFTRVYRIKSKDLPLTAAEKQKLQSMGG